ncbi:MAG: EAL domain-containing protein [Myxococcales bacterium]
MKIAELANTLEGMAALGVVLDASGRILWCSTFACARTGYSLGELVGANWFDVLVAPEEREARRALFVEGALADALPSRIDTVLVARDGRSVTVAWATRTLKGSDGASVGFAGVGIDFTEWAMDADRCEQGHLHDPLTGLANRAMFLSRLALALSRYRHADGHIFAVLVVDLDRFKVINDSLGHTAGDELLVEAGRVLVSCVRPQDTVARLGGDEFGVLVDGLDDAGSAVRLAGKIQDALRNPFRIGAIEAFTTASIGIALSGPSYDRPEDVLRDADNAMYRAKARGKARHEVFEESMHLRAVKLLELETDLRRALDRNELYVVYQPIVLLKTGAVTGFEALLRWRHPARGIISPVDFIPIAEETGLIVPIGQWVLEEACRTLRSWLVDNPSLTWLTISVNLSSKQFLAPRLRDDIDQTLTVTGIDPLQLKLEITESALMDNPEAAALLLADLRGRGIGLSIDDFGTGYSSLSYLLRFPLDTLKIDRAFVSGMVDTGGERAASNLELVRAIVTLARNLGMEVVAEGVETEGQRIRLEALGCQLAQGYLFSRPLEVGAARLLVVNATNPRARRLFASLPPAG